MNKLIFVVIQVELVDVDVLVLLLCRRAIVLVIIDVELVLIPVERLVLRRAVLHNSGRGCFGRNVGFLPGRHNVWRLLQHIGRRLLMVIGRVEEVLFIVIDVVFVALLGIYGRLRGGLLRWLWWR